MALSEIEYEIALADAELVALKDDVRRLVRNPVGTLLPGIIGPLISGVAEGLKSKKTKDSSEAD